MSISDAVRRVLTEKYATFEGRAGRPEYWWYVLALIIAQFVAAAIDMGLFGRQVITWIVGVATIVPSLAVGCRRLHDTDRSGWWQLLLIAPLVGEIILLVLWALPGTPGPNRFGASSA
jgi:uncharacterized membrane protein YhaH (DUF805 family)